MIRQYTGKSAALLSVAVLIMLIPMAATGQTVPDTAQSDFVRLDHADIWNGEEIDGREYIYLRGNVELSQDSIYFYCDSARIIDRQEVAAFGNVIIQKGDSLEVFSDTLLYFADTRFADLTGEVALVHHLQQLWTTHLTFDMEKDVASYDRPAQLIDSTTQLSSKRGIYWVQTEEALFLDSVVVIDEEFNLKSDSLRYHAATKVARFIAPTWIYQDDAEITCAAGFYDLANKRAEFRENPVYKSRDEFATAEVMTFDDSLKVVRLTGDALYSEGARMASGDTITYYQESGDVTIAGNAEFRDEKRHLTSGRIIRYNRNTEKVDVEGRGVLTEGSQIITADVFDMNNESGVGYLRGNVMIEDTSAQTILESETVEYLEENGYMKATGTRRPVLKSLVDADTLYVTSEVLISYEIPDTLAGDTVRFLTGYHDVRIFRGMMQGLCDSITFDGRDSIFRMYGDPVLWSDTTQFTADTIDLHVRGKALDMVVLRSNALIISSVLDKFYDQISGKRVVADVDSSVIRSMHVTGNAQSVYYVLDDVKAFIGVNQVVSSEIFFTFLGGRLDQIKFVTRPSGTMTPMNMLDHSTLRLEGFRWRSEERPKKLEDLF